MLSRISSFIPSFIVNNSFVNTLRYFADLISQIGHVFYRVIAYPFSFSELQAPPLPSNAIPLRAYTLSDLRSHISTQVTPLSESISDKLKELKEVDKSDSKILEEVARLYVEMETEIQKAQNAIKTHPAITRETEYTVLNEEMCRCIKLVDDFQLQFFQATQLDSLIPIGLYNENGNDCFLNALRQLFMGIPDLLENVLQKLPSESYHILKTSAIRYRLKQMYPSASSLDGSRAIRGEIGMQTGRQEDPTEALDRLLGEFTPASITSPLTPPFFCTETSTQYDLDDYAELSDDSQESLDETGVMKRSQPESYLTLPLSSAETISFEDILKSWAIPPPNGSDGFKVRFRDDRPEAELPFQYEKKRFIDLPMQLICAFKRFEYVGNSPQKIGRIIDLKDKFIIPHTYVSNEQSGLYQISGFISHLGQYATSGHYIAYIRQPDGNWYCCNDSDVKPATSIQVAAALQTCYVIYAKLERNMNLEETRAFLKERQFETHELETDISTLHSLQEAEEALKKRFSTLDKEVKAVQSFYDSLLPGADGRVMEDKFKALPSECQQFFSTVLKLEKKENLLDLKSITLPYLIKKEESDLSQNIVEQFIYIKKQLLLFMQDELDKKENSEALLSYRREQVYALKSLFASKEALDERLNLVLPFMMPEIQQKLEQASLNGVDPITLLNEMRVASRSA